VHLLRINDRALSEAGRLEPAGLRSLHAIHLASARQLGASVRQIVTYDDRMAEAARTLGWSVIARELMGGTPATRAAQQRRPWQHMASYTRPAGRRRHPIWLLPAQDTG
jgi:hypothetical protein